MTRPDFWTNSGWHLLEATADGWLKPGADYFRAYFLRPEMRPEDNACAAELALHQHLVANPLDTVEPAALSAIADDDARYNYEVVTGFRDMVLKAGTLEAAYLQIIAGKAGVPVPPLFVDQLVHAVLRQILKDAEDPLRARAAELMFRTQTVSADDGRLMLADDETVDMYARTSGGGLGQLIADAETPLRQVELQVLDENNAAGYWPRSDRFDTVIDLRFTQPPLDALCRVLEAWLFHFTRLKARIQPLQSISDDHWTWHIGLDVHANRILNALYKGEDLGPGDDEAIIALFRLTLADQSAVIDAVKGKPVYLGLAKSPAGKITLKPQNLLQNLPLNTTA